MSRYHKKISYSKPLFFGLVASVFYAAITASFADAADSIVYSVPNVVVCFEHADSKTSRSAADLKNPNCKLDLDLSFFRDLSFMGSTSAPTQLAAVSKCKEVKRPNDPEAEDPATKDEPNDSRINSIELLALSRAKNIRNGKLKFSATEGYTYGGKNDLILPEKNEDPFDFALKIIHRLKYYSDYSAGDSNPGLYADLVKILTGPHPNLEKGEFPGAQLSFEPDAMISVPAQVGPVANAVDKIAGDLPDRNNCIVTTYSQQIEVSDSNLAKTELPKAIIKFDARLLNSTQTHSYQSRGLFYLDQVMFYASRRLFTKTDGNTDYSYLLADLLRKDLTINKLAQDLTPVGYPRKDAIVIEYHIFIAASQDLLGVKPPYANNPALKKKWQDFLKTSFLDKLATSKFNYVPQDSKLTISNLMTNALDSYWKEFVENQATARVSTEINLQVYFNKHVYSDLPSNIVIPVGNLK